MFFFTAGSIAQGRETTVSRGVVSHNMIFTEPSDIFQGRKYCSKKRFDACMLRMGRLFVLHRDFNAGMVAWGMCWVIWTRRGQVSGKFPIPRRKAEADREKDWKNSGILLVGFNNRRPLMDCIGGGSLFPVGDDFQEFYFFIRGKFRGSQYFSHHPGEIRNLNGRRSGGTTGDSGSSGRRAWAFCVGSGLFFQKFLYVWKKFLPMFRADGKDFSVDPGIHCRVGDPDEVPDLRLCQSAVPVPDSNRLPDFRCDFYSFHFNHPFSKESADGSVPVFYKAVPLSNGLLYFNYLQ